MCTYMHTNDMVLGYHGMCIAFALSVELKNKQVGPDNALQT